MDPLTQLPGPVPDDLAEVRRRLHVLAANVLTPARYRATGRIGLRSSPGGFRTPPFEVDGQQVEVRVEGDHLVVVRDGTAVREPISTLGSACRLVLGQDGPDLSWVDDLSINDRPESGGADLDLTVPAATVRWIGDWFGLGWTVLQALAADDESTDASEPQIWPEHFDGAIEVLPDRRRGSYGFSPGDGGVAEPYAYLSIWYADDLGVDRSSAPWGATTFPGAAVTASEVLRQQDQVGFLVDWFRERRDLLAAAPGPT